MFKISSKESYTWPVTVAMPKDGGGFTKNQFNAEFLFLDQEKIDEVLANARAGRDNGDICKAALKGWDGVNDENNAPLPFNEDNLALMLRKPYRRNAIVAAFVDSITGDEARRKN